MQVTNDNSVNQNKNNNNQDNAQNSSAFSNNQNKTDPTANKSGNFAPLQSNGSLPADNKNNASNANNVSTSNSNQQNQAASPPPAPAAVQADSASVPSAETIDKGKTSNISAGAAAGAAAGAGGGADAEPAVLKAARQNAHESVFPQTTANIKADKSDPNSTPSPAPFSDIPKDKDIDKVNNKEFDAVVNKAFKNITDGKALSSDSPQQKEAQEALDKIMPSVNKLIPDSKNWKPEVLVTDGKDFNAGTPGNGKIGVDKIVVDKLGKDELSFVLAHEIAHSAQEHSKEKLVRDIKDKTSSSDELAESRKNEIEADNIAMRIIKDAGLPPDSGKKLFQEMNNLQEAGMSKARAKNIPIPKEDESKNSHPSIDARIANIEEQKKKLGMS